MTVEKKRQAVQRASRPTVTQRKMKPCSEIVERIKENRAFMSGLPCRDQDGVCDTHMVLELNNYVS